VLILGLVSVVGLSYMSCKNQNLRLAAETRELRLKFEAIERRNTALSLDLEWMKSPALLKRRLVEMNSQLVPLYDPRMIAHVTRMEGQSTRMILAKMGTDPQVDINATPVGANSVSATTDTQR
jgi:hypothetical protein